MMSLRTGRLAMAGDLEREFAVADEGAGAGRLDDGEGDGRAGGQAGQRGREAGGDGVAVVQVAAVRGCREMEADGRAGAETEGVGHGDDGQHGLVVRGLAGCLRIAGDLHAAVGDGRGGRCRRGCGR